MKKKSILSKIKVVKTSFFWLYFIIGGLFILTSLFFTPFWLEISEKIPWSSWSAYALGIIVGVLIFLYVFIILLKRVKQPTLKNIPRVVMCVEFGIMIVFAVCAILKGVLYNNEKFKFFNTCEILAIIIWVRGVVEIINAYYHDSKDKLFYPIWYLIINIFLISFGPLLMLIGIKYSSKVDEIVSYVICGILLFLGTFFCIYGGLCKPIKIVEEPVEIKKEPVKETLKIEKKVENQELNEEKDTSKNDGNEEKNNEIIDIKDEKKEEVAKM